MTETTDHLLARALAEVHAYQDRLEHDPEVAQVTLGGEPQALVPTHVLTHDLPLAVLEIMGPQATPRLMCRLGRLIGSRHAAAFFADRQIAADDLEHRVLTGPFHFAWAGYGDVDLLVWEPSPDENFIVMWESDHSCSAKEAQREGLRTRACHLQAGYAAGWCAEATGLPLEATELACRAERVSHCRFIIAHADRSDSVLLDPRFHRPTKDYTVTPARQHPQSI